MKRLIKLGVMLAAASAVVLAPLTSVKAEPTAKPRGEVTFSLVFQAPAPDVLTGTVEGSFVAVGAVQDSGAATETYTLTPVSETLITVSGVKILEGRRGTIVMTFQAELYDGGLWGVAQWQIIAGSGAYKKIRGSGGGTFLLEFPEGAPPYLAAEYTGSISKDPSLR